MEQRVTDRHGAVLVPNHQQRVRRLYANGQPVRGGTSYVLDARVDDKGRAVVDYEELASQKRGTCLAEQVEVLRSDPKHPTKAERQYRVDKEAAAAVSKRVAKRREGLLR